MEMTRPTAIATISSALDSLGASKNVSVPMTIANPRAQLAPPYDPKSLRVRA